MDFDKKIINCTSTLGDCTEKYQISYDHLLVACGMVTNTFGIEGVHEHAYFLKDISDAKKIRGRVIECFERASQPGVSEKEKWNLLHFAVVGGGPTGIEFSAELYDFVRDDMANLYPELSSMVTMTVFDVSPRILNGFDDSLSKYAMARFERQGIQLRLSTITNLVHELTRRNRSFKS